MITGYGGTRLAQGEKGAFFNTLEELKNYFEKIDIIAPKGSIAVSGKETKVFDNVFIHCSDKNILLQPFFIKRKGIEIFKKQKFEAMTVHEYPPFYNGIGANMLWNKIKIPFMSEIHHIPGYPRSANIKERIYKLLSGILISSLTENASIIRVDNMSQVPPFLVKSGVDSAKIKLISPFYIDFDVFNPTETEKKYDLMFAGRLSENKGLKLFLKVVEESKSSAVIVGGGPLRDWLEKEVRRLNLSDRITIKGWLENHTDVAKIINESKIFAMFSDNEGGPRVVLEAMACGVPVVATPVGIVCDVIKEKYHGAVVNWDSKEIAQTVTKILGEYDEVYWPKRFEISNYMKIFEKSKNIIFYAGEIKDMAH